MAWNALPDDLRDPSLDQCRHRKGLKTHLFRNALGQFQGHRNRHVSIRHIGLPGNVHSKHGPISYRFRDKRRFQSKSTIFPSRVFCAWNWVPAFWDKKIRMTIPSAIWIQYTNVTDRRGQTDGRTVMGTNCLASSYNYFTAISPIM